jgi:hypothetical protein
MSGMAGTCLAWESTPENTQALLHSILRDASTVLRAQAPAPKYCPTPPRCAMEPLGCNNLGTNVRPYYHGGSLLP